MAKKKLQKNNNLWKEDNYLIIREAIPFDITSFIYAYFQNKRSVADYLFQSKYISPFDETWGTWQHEQIPGTYSHYGDLVMETLLTRMMPVMKKFTNLELVPTYSYARLYKYGDILHRHKDRPSCEISCTINLGGDKWPIFLEPSGKKGQEGVRVDLNPGDLLMYKGTFVEHWRQMFEGNECCQVFLHYNDKNGRFGTSNINDTRPLLGLPSDFKKQ
jgi:hypothetical protein|tara:strand:+ start:665 stop:1315 length:651 start_codon:yes stop_codon:yes gene_type:complete